MKTLVQSLATLAPRREAVAEAVLVHALQFPAIRRRMARELALRPAIRLVTAQVSSTGRDARHDIVLELENGREVRIELKGDSPFTLRQVEALRKGPRAREAPRSMC